MLAGKTAGVGDFGVSAHTAAPNDRGERADTLRGAAASGRAVGEGPNLGVGATSSNNLNPFTPLRIIMRKATKARDLDGLELNRDGQKIR